MNRTNDRALAAKANGIELGGTDNELKAFYAGLRRPGKGPSKEYPCARCQPHEHWVVDCPLPPNTNEGSGSRGRKGKKRGGGEANAQAAVSASPLTESTESTALIAHGNIRKVTKEGAEVFVRISSKWCG